MANTIYLPLNDAGVGMVDKTRLDSNFAIFDAAISTGNGSAVVAAQAAADAAQADADTAQTAADAAQATADAALPKAGGVMTGTLEVWSRTTTQKGNIATPAAGMLVYDSTLGKLCVYTGAAWETVTST